MDTRSLVAITRIRTVSIPVRDQDQALAFYTDVLGFEKHFEATFGPGMRWIELGLPGGETSLALPPPGEGTPVGVDTGIRLETTDAAADHAALVGRGVEVDAEVMRVPGVPPMFSLRDPDGNRLYIVQNR